MTISVLVEALLLGGTGSASATGGGAVGKSPPKDEKGLKGWIKNKLKASLPGRKE